MAIRVEFFGIARHRAGVAFAELPIAGPASLETVFGHLAAEYPAFAAECLQGHCLQGHCLQGHCLQAGYVANIDGEQFVRDPATELPDGACLLIMAADAGG